MGDGLQTQALSTLAQEARGKGQAGQAETQRHGDSVDFGDGLSAAVGESNSKGMAAALS